MHNKKRTVGRLKATNGSFALYVAANRLQTKPIRLAYGAGN
jgi:hypothetical protein